jgi:hypothetical protein
MTYVTKEITREYRLDFNHGETHWDDPIPPEVTSGVLGKPTTRIINRMSLLAWSLMMSLGQVTVADVTAEGWMKIAVTSDEDFDEDSFIREITDTLAAVMSVRSYGEPRVAETRRPPPARALEPTHRYGQTVSSEHLSYV